jgi:alpha-glucosidase
LVLDPMVWEKSNQNGSFTAGRPWLPVASEHLAMSVAAQEDDPSALLDHYRRAVAFRQTHAALSMGDHDKVRATGDVMHFNRSNDGQEIFCAFNISDTPSDLDVPAGA